MILFVPTRKSKKNKILILGGIFLIIILFSTYTILQNLNWSKKSYGYFTIYFDTGDTNIVDTFSMYSSVAIKQISTYFPQTKIADFSLYLYSDRKKFNRVLQKLKRKQNYKSPQWLVGSTPNSDKIHILSPNSWEKDAPMHYPYSRDSIQMLITHEMVHLYQNQLRLNHSLTPLIKIRDPSIICFAEGLAVLIAGQYKYKKKNLLKSIARKDIEVSTFGYLWNERDRYALCGLFVGYIENKYGKEKIKELMIMTKSDDFISKINKRNDFTLYGRKTLLTYEKKLHE